MSQIPSAACANDAVIVRYEDLRRQVLDPSLGIHRGPGLALLLQSGMKTWMEVSSTCLPEPCSPTLGLSNRKEVLAPAQRGEIVMVLASMALHRYPEANA
jgi:hypothetical protein